MKVATVTTLLFATLALASPAPAAENTLQPFEELSHPVYAPHPARDLETRDPKKKKSKPKKPKSSNSTQEVESAAGFALPNRALELGALGLGVLEVVRLWG